MKLVLIAAHDSRLVIGKNGEIPWHYPEDLKFFKKTTLGFPILMGRKTFESIGSKPLPGRTNIVVSSRQKSQEGILVISNPDELSELHLNADKVFIVGGSAIYEHFLPIADELIITEIKTVFEGDTFFPDYRKDIGLSWFETSRESHNDFDYVYYKRKK